MKKLIFILALSLLLSSVNFGQTRKARPVGKPAVKTTSVPKSKPVVKREPEASAEEPKIVGLTIERYVNNIEVNSDGTSVETLEMLQRFQSEAAIEGLSKFERVFNGDLETAEVLETYILKADGKKITLPSTASFIKPTPQAEAAPSFSSLKMIEIKFDGLEKGDAAYFKIRLKTVKPMFGNHFDTLEILPAIYEWKSAEINLTAPADYPIYAQAVDFEGGKLPVENGKQRWQWRKNNLPAREIETGMYDWLSFSPRVAVTSFKNFEELGAAFWAEAKEKAVVTPEIQALADEITKDSKNPKEQAHAIYEWVNKNIRYLLIFLERGGWVPHKSSEILANRYGDCKDYTTILYALLKAKNIESHPVLIRSDLTDWFPETATPQFFNHAILYIPSLNLFADATAPNTRLGLIPQTLVGKKAVLSGEKTGIIVIPAGKPADNELLSEVEINFAPNGNLKAISKNIYNGRTEIVFRPLFADSRLQTNSEDFIRLILSYFGVDGSGRILKIGNPFQPGEPFRIELEVNLENYTTFMPKGELMLPVALNLMNTLELEQFVKEEKRTTNFLLGAAHFREDFKLNFPEGVTVESLPPAVNFKNAVGSYRNEFKLEGGSVRVLRELIINKDVIKVEEYSLARELINKSVEGYNAKIKYQANPQLARLKSKELRNKPAAQKPKSVEEFLLKRYELTEKKLTARESAQLETKLKTNPNDIESRKMLLRFYSDYEIKPTPARAKSRLRHRLWFVQNRPEMTETEIFGFGLPYGTTDEGEYQILKAEWLKQVAANKTNAQIRLNAVAFLRYEEPETAENLLLEGQKINGEDYRFPFLLSDIYHDQAESFENAENPAKIKEFFQKGFETGEKALILLKKERSASRDYDRRELLQNLVVSAFQMEKFDRAKSFATEIILDFGQDSTDSGYTQATHIGNIYLGRAALREGNTAKAKEHLLIAVRAPLRQVGSYLSEIDTELAKELFNKGEKEAVLEYLKLSESLWHLKTQPELYEDELKALKLWQEQIRQGKTPSFNFYEP